MVLTEHKLQISIDDKSVIDARKFDDTSHRLSHCMKAVDFIVELSDHYLFIELKDPQVPQATETQADWCRRFQSGQIDEDLKYKYRDTFLYEWALGRANKPIDYLVLIALDTLAPPLLQNRLRALQQKLPLNGPDDQFWPRPFVRSCGVFNIALWNRHFPQYPVTRLP